MEARVKALLDMPSDADEGWAEEVLHPDVFPDHELAALKQALVQWAKSSGDAAILGIEQWLNSNHAERPAHVSALIGGILNKDGLPNGNLRHAKKFDPEFTKRQQLVTDSVALYNERRALLDLATFLTGALEMGRAFALRWDAAKQREGYLDFDDLIRRAASLLGSSDASAWIRYKLDRSFDHILIDEAQDTNAAQWSIVDALIDDFFAGDAARGDKIRTIFAVGDYKQAIFGFQGTSPENFERAKHKVKARIDAARANAHEMRDQRRLPTWNDLDLGRSFRTALPVLDFVNQTMEAIGYGAFGLTKPATPHIGDDRAGLVALWEPVTGPNDVEVDGEEEQERDWLPAHDTQMARTSPSRFAAGSAMKNPLCLRKASAAMPGRAMSWSWSASAGSSRRRLSPSCMLKVSRWRALIGCGLARLWR